MLNLKLSYFILNHPMTPSTSKYLATTPSRVDKQLHSWVLTFGQVECFSSVHSHLRNWHWPKAFHLAFLLRLGPEMYFWNHLTTLRKCTSVIQTKLVLLVMFCYPGSSVQETEQKNPRWAILFLSAYNCEVCFKH